MEAVLTALTDWPPVWPWDLAGKMGRLSQREDLGETTQPTALCKLGLRKPGCQRRGLGGLATNMSLLLLKKPEDPPTFYSRSFMTTSTPDLAFATEDIALKTTRQVMGQLGGSDHKPVPIEVEMKITRNTTSALLRRNYKNANWDHFTALSDELAIPFNARSKNRNQGARAIIDTIIKSAKRS
ncbi:hypothetical protein ElyMa_001468800 [Elysia marginata]|uniref:Endonuclease/exonuclease/phosphatase domain-containing protein n=1 Tax=Elysia marginata TaxID=1093978 RepID=A0AAV4J1K1_9GAST|nr:hypothetical protein ElyMa_001468800 [Elysia marginata]